MARLAKDCNRTRPWKAECRINYFPWFLGYFETRDLAMAAEREFRLEMRGDPEPRRKDIV